MNKTFPVNLERSIALLWGPLAALAEYPPLARWPIAVDDACDDPIPLPVVVAMTCSVAHDLHGPQGPLFVVRRVLDWWATSSGADIRGKGSPLARAAHACHALALQHGPGWAIAAGSSVARRLVSRPAHVSLPGDCAEADDAVFACALDAVMLVDIAVNRAALPFAAASSALYAELGAVHPRPSRDFDDDADEAAAATLTLSPWWPVGAASWCVDRLTRGEGAHLCLADDLYMLGVGLNVPRTRLVLALWAYRAGLVEVGCDFGQVREAIERFCDVANNDGPDVAAALMAPSLAVLLDEGGDRHLRESSLLLFGQAHPELQADVLRALATGEDSLSKWALRASGVESDDADGADNGADHAS